MKSRSQNQLIGEETSLSEIKSSEDCDPIYTNGDMGFDDSTIAADNKTSLM